MKRLLIGFLLIFLFPITTRAASPIVINEFYTPTSSDWVEIYNTSDTATDINAWYLKDSTSNIYTFPASSSIGSHAFLAVDVSNRLNKDGDNVVLFDNNNQQIDSKTYSSDPGDGISIGRYPDGDNWTLLQTLTKGSSNSSGSPIPTPTLTPSPTNTPSPTSSPTNTPASTSTPKPPSPTPTKKPTPTLTPKPTEEQFIDDEESSLEDQLLGASTSAEDTAGPFVTPKPKSKSSISPVPAIITGLGLILITVGSAPLLLQYIIKTKRKT